MSNTVDIMYYEFMIELAEESQKINEAIMAPKFAKLCESADQEEIAVAEANVVESILNFIKTLFRKVMEFLDKLVGIATRRDTFFANKQLIAACKEKMKSISREGRDSFKLEKINLHDSINDAIESINKDMLSVNESLDETMDALENVLKRVGFAAALDPIKENIQLYDERLSSFADLGKMAKTDIDYNDVVEMFEVYEDAKSNMETVKKSVKSTKDKMKSCDDRANMMVRLNPVENMFTESLRDYKNVINLATSYITKASKTEIGLVIASYKNKEEILKRFIAYSSANESVIDFDAALESVIFVEYQEDDIA